MPFSITVILLLLLHTILLLGVPEMWQQESASWLRSSGRHRKKQADGGVVSHTTGVTISALR